MSHRVFITGAAGYIGGMLCDLFAQRADVEAIVALDKEPMPEPLHGNRKIRWVAANTADAAWQAIVAGEAPDIVIHAAWQIREMYGKAAQQRQWNVAGSDAVFEFAFATPSVKRLLYFSTVSSYGAEPGNSVAHRFKEDEGLRPSDFRYAEEKRLVEGRLARKFAEAHEKGSDVSVVVLRPAAVTGPRGRSRRNGLLLSALSGHRRGSALDRLVSLMGSLVPVTPDWCRQFVHEDDLTDAVARLAFGDLADRYGVFNVGPPGEVLRGQDLAQAFHKIAIRVHPQLIRLAFFLLWHGTRGKICTPPGAWKSYSYPLAVDAAKLTDMYAVRYRMDSKEAFVREAGRYAPASAPAEAPFVRAASSSMM